MGVEIQALQKSIFFTNKTMTTPFLVFAIGNESRGDDALAPLLVRQLLTEGINSQVELIEDYQLQVEHVTDLAGRSVVLFVDADMSCEAPFQLHQPCHDAVRAVAYLPAGVRNRCSEQFSAAHTRLRFRTGEKPE